MADLMFEGEYDPGSDASPQDFPPPFMTWADPSKLPSTPGPPAPEDKPSAATTGYMQKDDGDKSDSGDKSDNQPISRDAASALERGYDENMERLKAAGEETQKSYQERQAALDPLYADARRAIGDRRGTAPPQLEKMPKAPERQLGQGAMEFMQIATLLGALAGGLARRGTTASLNAFAGAIKGFSEGDYEAFKQKSEEWKQKSEEVKENNQTKLDQYKTIMQDKKLDIDQKMEMIKLVATQYDDKIAYNLANERRIEMFGQMQLKQSQFQQSYEIAQQKMEKNRLDILEKTQQLEQDDNKAIDAVVDRLYAGERDAVQKSNIGRGKQGDRRILEVQQRLQQKLKENGLSMADLQAQNARWRAVMQGSGALGTRSAALTAALEKLDAQAPAAIAASDAMPRNMKFQTVNQLYTEMQHQLNNPKATIFLQDNLSLAEAWAQAMAPGSTTVRQDLVERALSILNAGLSTKNYRAAVNNLRQIIQRERQGVGAAITNFSQSGLGGGPGNATQPQQQQPPQQNAPQGGVVKDYGGGWGLVGP